MATFGAGMLAVCGQTNSDEARCSAANVLHHLKLGRRRPRGVLSMPVLISRLAEAFRTCRQMFKKPDQPRSTSTSPRRRRVPIHDAHAGAGHECVSRRRLSCFRAQVARLVGVMDERKVFGNSGARFMKELLAEADSRAKKLSARAGGAVQSNGTAAPGGASTATMALYMSVVRSLNLPIEWQSTATSCTGSQILSRRILVHKPCQTEPL